MGSSEIVSVDLAEHFIPLIAYYQSVTPDHLSAKDLDLLLSQGWYRMHQNIFRTTHLSNDVNLYRVHWLRYPLADVRERASHRRIRNRNKSFRLSIEDVTTVRPDHEELFVRYGQSIDFDGALSVRHGLFGEEGIDRRVYKTKCISVYDGNRLIAGGYFDVGSQSATSILHFFDPLYKKYSLGKYLMLLTADFLRTNGYTYYYPGYLVAGLPKMDYKLFIGKEVTQYFDPETKTWKSYQERILKGEELTPVQQLELMLSFYS